MSGGPRLSSDTNFYCEDKAKELAAANSLHTDVAFIYRHRCEGRPWGGAVREGGVSIMLWEKRQRQEPFSAPRRRRLDEWAPLMLGGLKISCEPTYRRLLFQRDNKSSAVSRFNYLLLKLNPRAPPPP